MSVVPDLARSRIAVGSWSRRVEALGLSSDHWEALLHLQKGLGLRVEWLAGSDHLTASLWALDRIQGGAVVLEDDVPAWFTAIPVCSCGDQGCSNASFRFQVTIAVLALPALVDMLQALPQRNATLSQLKALPLWEGPSPEA